MLHPSQFLALLTITVLATLTLYLHTISDTSLWYTVSRHRPKLPDFEQYIYLRVLTPQEFPIDDPRRRVIIVGDIHGMQKPLQLLLDNLAYDHHNDVLVHTGDIFVRESPQGPLQVIDFLTTFNITGVRGNHDQKLIEWKAWLDWFETLPDGGAWLSHLESKWRRDEQKGQELKAWVKQQRRQSRGADAKWWSLIPDGWIPFGEHFDVAQALTQEQYAYLLSLPLKLHIPSAHAFVIHAGLLPYDVSYEYDDHKRQPLARVPRVHSYRPPYSKKEVEVLRTLQELEIAYRVPQNSDPWTNLNMRSILDTNKVSRNWKEGTPWTKYWNHQMSMCDGFHQDHILHLQDQELQPILARKTLPCYPASVIYGHSAGVGLNVNRWSFGLDTGCVYGRKLTALILGPNPLPSQDEWEEEEDDEPIGGEDGHDNINDDWLELDDDEYNDLELEGKPVNEHYHTVRKARTVKFGEHGKAKLVHVPCS